MVYYYRTDDRIIHEEEEISMGVWVNMVNPTMTEGEEIARKLDIDLQDLLAALDEEESSRVELEDGYTLILVDIPATEIRHDKEAYNTIPLGIILTKDIIITVCAEETPVLTGVYQWKGKRIQYKEKIAFCLSDAFQSSSIIPVTFAYY